MLHHQLAVLRQQIDRAAVGESPYSYLMTRRIERAATMLRCSDTKSPTRASPSGSRPLARSPLGSPSATTCHPESAKNSAVALTRHNALIRRMRNSAQWSIEVYERSPV